MNLSTIQRILDQKNFEKKFEFLYAFTVNKKPKEVDESRKGDKKMVAKQKLL